MAKGQLRGNKETKKPKQNKSPASPATPFGGVGKGASQTPDSKKK